MVYKGPSRGCYTCRRRRVKCDEGRPQCGNCIKRKQECPGYRDLFDAVHKDETFVVSHKGSTKRCAKSDSSSDEDNHHDIDMFLGPLSADAFKADLTAPDLSMLPPKGDELTLLLLKPSRNFELESLYYFFSNYVNIPRDPSTNIFVEHILPLYINAPAHSALAQAINAVAINVTQMWMARFSHSYLAQEAYGKAVALLKESLQDPVQSRTDNTLATVFMLDFYDSLNKRFTNFIDTGTHQQGAVALLRHRGKDNFKTALSQRLFTAMRSRHINYSLQTGQEVQLDDDLLAEDTAVLPSAKLDLINVELADLHMFARNGPSAAGLNLIEFYQAIIKRALIIDQKLQAWRDSLPKSWQPVPIPASQLHPSIRAAGVYEDTCDVYSSLSISHINNASRSSHIGALRLVALSMKELEELGVGTNPELGPYLYKKMQEIVDRFCASIPYHLGNRTTLSFPHEHREYPHVPEELRRQAKYVDPFGNEVEMTMEDHMRAAAAIGGWFIMTPLAGFLKAPALQSKNFRPGPLIGKLRKGQLEWIRGQTQRIQKIYLVPDAATDSDWLAEMKRFARGLNIFQAPNWNRETWAV
ncbi:uncharacterized protein Z518_04186 [Rhinocladiella mackenziei CBS 650.93]|uniref:Zn(2)-C6 fungal-type domain-containing protein n=1 Tax=Rhinocladiella mackenziei CBS 650.93 TaxID=1442369 RepID=A0A0D2ISR4_9EURO|nr:uncharacterized protein Z518_04186 [Rhinocladiella mackenziei CBS 650.93]KIX06211.1 hypothetical protein Z518_04186 [Rhinocladiella mackenziei CBS 650.93]